MIIPTSALHARYLDATGVADYLSISSAMVDQLTERGVLPKPILLTKRLKRWDRDAIDQVLANGALPNVGPLRRSTTDIARKIADDLAAGNTQSKKAPARR